MPHLPEDRLALVRQLYEASELTIAEIAVLADVSESAIYQRARREQWATSRRPGVTPRKAKLRPPLPPTPALREMTAHSAGNAGGDAARMPAQPLTPPPGQPPAQAGDDAVDRPDVDRAGTARRLWRAVNRHLEALEADAAPDTVVRAAQNLSTLARTLETLIDVERGLQAEAPAGAAPQGDEGPEDIDEFRNEICRRLEAMHGGDAVRAGAEAPESGAPGADVANRSGGASPGRA